MSRNARGEVVLKLKSPYRDDTTHIVLQPQEFIQRLAALLPRPGLHLIRYPGVLAPNAKLRGALIPQPEQSDNAPAHEHAHGQAARMSWARLLKRVRWAVEDPRRDRRAGGDREDPHAPGPAPAAAAARSAAELFTRLRSLTGEQDDGSATEPTDVLGP